MMECVRGLNYLVIALEIILFLVGIFDDTRTVKLGQRMVCEVLLTFTDVCP